MLSLGAGRRRSRVFSGLAVVAAILLGLASRRYPGAVPAVLGKYPGDALWAMVVFFGWGTLQPKASTVQIAALAFLTSIVVEVLKLYQAPWIVDVRHTTLGHLVFGHVFSFGNIAAYAVGIVTAVGVDGLYFLRSADRSSGRDL